MPYRAATLALAIALGGVFAAAPVAITPVQAQASEYSTEELTAFVTAALAVNEIEVEYVSRIQASQNDGEREQLMEEAGNRMAAAVEETPGMNVERYLEIAQAAQTDAALNDRLMQVLEDIQSE